jgi:tRNA nucleotidyltransferase/poly(A) polymerase
MPVYLVGGGVRDLLSNERPLDKDIDFLVEGNALEFAAALGEKIGGQVKTFADFYTAKIVSPAKLPSIAEIDLASARTERYEVPGALPKVELADLAHDLKRRDFSINAMALPLAALVDSTHVSAAQFSAAIQPKIVDHFEGLKDLSARIIRVLHERSFIDDPTRMFRAARYAVRIGGALEVRTEGFLRSAIAAGALSTISEQRKFNEMRKVFQEKNWPTVLAALRDWGIPQQIEITAAVNSDEYSSALEKLSRIPELCDYSDKAGVFAALAGAYSSSPDISSALSKIGFSKRRGEEAATLREIASSDPKMYRRAHDTTCVAAFLISGRKDWWAELSERKLLGSER